MRAAECHRSRSSRNSLDNIPRSLERTVDCPSLSQKQARRRAVIIPPSSLPFKCWRRALVLTRGLQQRLSSTVRIVKVSDNEREIR